MRSPDVPDDDKKAKVAAAESVPRARVKDLRHRRLAATSRDLVRFCVRITRVFCRAKAVIAMCTKESRTLCQRTGDATSMLQNLVPSCWLDNEDRVRQ